jgi:hypothetical protein
VTDELCGPGKTFRRGPACTDRGRQGRREALAPVLRHRRRGLDLLRPNSAVQQASLAAETSAEQSAFRFSGERPGPRESTTVRLSRPDGMIGQLGVQDRLHVSTTVVSTALATGISVRRSDPPLPRRGVAVAVG